VQEVPTFLPLGVQTVDDFKEVFLKVRPDEVAFNEKAKVCVFLKFTRPMDSRDSASEQLNWWSRKKGATWTTAQYNFTVGVSAPQFRQPGRTDYLN